MYAFFFRLSTPGIRLIYEQYNQNILSLSVGRSGRSAQAQHLKYQK